MSRRLARGALRLYPLAHRRRYGAEIEALLEDSPAGPLTVLDLLRGAVIAHARPAATATAALSPGERVRSSTSAILACWIAFAAAGTGFYKTTEGPAFARAGDAHVALGGSHIAIQALAGLASVAILVGALPLVIASARQLRRSRPARRATGLAAGAVALFGIATAALVVLANAVPPLSAGTEAAVLVGWSAIALACGVACAIAARGGLFAIDVGRRALTTALSLGTVVTVSMASIAVATAIYLSALAIDSGALAGETNGPLGLITVAASVVGQLAIMAVSSSLATVTTVRGWRALSSA
jgi:hypothetical protein